MMNRRSFFPAAGAALAGVWRATTAYGQTPPGAPVGGQNDATTGRLLETVEFLPGSADPHGLTMWNGVLYGCDAGIHPGWPNNWSKTTGQIFRIDLI